MDNSWKLNAACRQADADVFFPDDSNRSVYNQARAICARCTVRVECLLYASLLNIEYGMWGGLTAEERRFSVNQTAEAAMAAGGHGTKGGTITGYFREKAAGLPPCDDCASAYRTWRRETRAARQRVPA